MPQLSSFLPLKLGSAGGSLHRKEWGVGGDTRCDSEVPDLFNRPKKLKNVFPSPNMGTLEKENKEHINIQDPVVLNKY